MNLLKNTLFLQLETLSPNDFKFQGTGLKIYCGFQATHLGQALIATTSKGICSLQFLKEVAREPLEKEWPKAEIIFAPEVTQAISDAIFHPTPSDSKEPLKLLLKGTDFQIKVWRALLKVPAGSTISYQELAQMIDQPTSTRAVGNAVGRNPIGYLIPCHRVIRSSGALGGYRWGLECKKALLSWEKSF